MSDNRLVSLICPGPEGWMAWQRGEAGAWTLAAELPATAKPWDFPQAKAQWVLALPLRTIQTMAIKVQAVEKAKVDELLPLRLEAAGLDSGGDGVVLTDWTVAGQASENCTVTAWAIDSGALDGCPASRLPIRVVPGFARWNWAARDLTFWREEGRWMVAFSGETFPVHVQTCAGTDAVGPLTADLQGQAMALFLRGLASPPARLVVRGASAPFAEDLARGLGLPVVECPDIPECLPEQSRLVSKEMLAARRARQEARMWRKRLAVVAVLWIGVAAYGGWRYMEAKRALDAARDAHDSIMPKDQAMREVQQAWDQIAAVNSVDAFPLEVLLRLTKTMPPADFRLTTFTLESDRDVYIKGSAKRPDLALRFAQDLRRDKALAAFAWETPYPVNEKDGSATFTYQGKFRANLP